MKNDPFILAIETSLQNGSLSIFKGQCEIGTSTGERNAARAEDLLEMIRELLKSKNLKPREIDLISVSVGPGSFTGIRVGIATALALAKGLKCPCVGVSLLDALRAHATSLSNFSNFISVLPSGREQAFWQIFFKEKEQVLSKPEAGSLENLINAILKLKPENLTVIAEQTIYQKLKTPFSEISEVFNKNLELLNASDNASNYIARFIQQEISNKNPLSLSSITPQYSLEVEIGRKG